MIIIEDLCKTCDHYLVDFPLPPGTVVDHCSILDEKTGTINNKMYEIIPYPCVECPFNCYLKRNNMVKWYSECACCGAIILYFNNGTHKVVHKNYIKDNNIDLTKSVKLANSCHCKNCYPMETVFENM